MKCEKCGSNVFVANVGHFGEPKYQIRCSVCEHTKLINEDEFLEIIKNTPPKTTKLLIVEDGSIDIENCEQDLLDMGIKCIICRKGSQPPILYDLGE